MDSLSRRKVNWQKKYELKGDVSTLIQKWHNHVDNAIQQGITPVPPIIITPDEYEQLLTLPQFRAGTLHDNIKNITTFCGVKIIAGN